MTLAFQASSVECTSAIGGEILQVAFDTAPNDQEEEQRTTPYVLISRNFEFPGSPTVEWHNGSDYDGGAKIVTAALRRDGVFITLDRDLEISVTFTLPDRKFAKLRSFLKRMLDDTLKVSE